MISKTASFNIKGIACLGIAIHHYIHFAGISTYFLTCFFSLCCAFFVSVFFFLSGYGLTKSLECKKSTFFSFRNMIITSTHDINNFSIVIGKPVTIGDNVWITSNVTILAGVVIGSNTIIGAGSIVTNNIPSGVFAAGNPCKVIRKIDFKK
jgi:acetyltransferase-like isoleucine patch superfamily enzyme